MSLCYGDGGPLQTGRQAAQVCECVMQEATEADNNSLPGSTVVFPGLGLLDTSDILGIRRLNLKYIKNNDINRQLIAVQKKLY